MEMYVYILELDRNKDWQVEKARAKLNWLFGGVKSGFVSMKIIEILYILEGQDVGFMGIRKRMERGSGY